MRINVVYIGGIAYAADIADRDWYLKILRGKVEEWGGLRGHREVRGEECEELKGIV